MPGPRIVESEQQIEWTIFGNLYGSSPKSSFGTKPIVLLEVCRESREETLKRYSPILSTKFNDFQVYFDHKVDTCFIVPTLPQGDILWIMEQQIAESLRSVIDGFCEDFLKSLRSLAIVSPCGLLFRDNSIEHLRPLLKFRNLERITWATGTCMGDCSRCGGRERRKRFTPQRPFSPYYWFGDPDVLLPFRNTSLHEPGHFIDPMFREVKHTIGTKLAELDTEWQIPELVVRIIVPRMRQKRVSSKKFLFNGEIHE
jgi:hypothetical protein